VVVLVERGDLGDRLTGVAVVVLVDDLYGVPVDPSVRVGPFRPYTDRLLDLVGRGRSRRRATRTDRVDGTDHEGCFRRRGGGAVERGKTGTDQCQYRETSGERAESASDHRSPPT
jgi:hypothetical protein